MIVVKIGGAAGVAHDAVLDDLADRSDGWVLVHGASDGASALGERLGHPPQFVTSPSGHVSRLTDAETLEAFAMASGLLNLRLVEGLQARGVNALGLSGPDGRVLAGRRKQAFRALTPDGRQRVVRGDFSGSVDTVNADLLRLLTVHGYAPVIGLPVLADGATAVNADADRAAAAVAAAVGADALVILSNVPGLLRDPEDPESRVARVGPADWADAEALAQGRFRKKLLAAREALAAGVPRVVIGSANVENPVRAALAGAGTVLEGAPEREVPA